MGVLEPHQILSSHFIYHSGKSWSVSLDSVEKSLIITLKVNYLCCLCKFNSIYSLLFIFICLHDFYDDFASNKYYTKSNLVILYSSINRHNKTHSL